MYSEDDYDEATEVDGSTLDEPGSPIVLALLGRFLRATCEGWTGTIPEDADPFPTGGPVTAVATPSDVG